MDRTGQSEEKKESLELGVGRWEMVYALLRKDMYEGKMYVRMALRWDVVCCVCSGGHIFNWREPVW